MDTTRKFDLDFSHCARTAALLFLAVIGPFFYSGCTTGIVSSNGIIITYPELRGSGTADDPYLLVKGTPLTFGTKDEYGNDVEAVWTISSPSTNVASGTGKSFSTPASSGSYSGNTLTPPERIAGSGLVQITATSVSDPSASESFYGIYIVADSIGFDSAVAYTPNSGYSFDSGNIAASKGMADILLSQTATSDEAEEAAEVLNTYLTDVSAAFTSIPVASPINPIIQGLPAVDPNDDWVVPSRIYIDETSHRCFVAITKSDTSRQYFFESDNCTVTGEAVVWNGPFYVSDEGNESVITNGFINADIMVDPEGLVHVAWVYPAEDGDLYYDSCQRASDSANYTCGTDKKLTNDASHTGIYRPYIKKFGNSVYIAWNADGGAKLVYSNDGGSTFSAEPVTGDGAASLINMNMDTSGKLYLSTTGKLYTYTNGDDELILVSNLGGDIMAEMYMDDHNDLYMAYVEPHYDDTDNPARITSRTLIYSKSADLGVSWSPEYEFPGIDISYTDEVMGNTPMSITGNGSDIYMVYTSDHNQSIYVLISRDRGASWGSPIRAANLNYDQDTEEPDYIHINPNPIYATAEGVYIPWDRNAKLTFCNSEGICSVTQEIGPSVPGSAVQVFRLGFGLEGSDTYGMIWSDGRNGNYDIYYSSNVYGNSPVVDGYRVSNSPYNEIVPAAAVGPDGAIHVIWFREVDHDNDRGYFYYSKSIDGGVSWEEPTRLTDATSELWNTPLIAVDALNRVHVAWADNHGCYADSCQWTFSVYYRRFENSAWSDVSIVAPPAPIMQFPSSMITSSNGTAYIANQEFTSYDGETIAIEENIIEVSAEDPTVFEERLIPTNGVVDYFGEGYVGSANFMLAIDRFDRITASWVRSQVGPGGGNYAVNSAGNGIYFARSADGGVTWSDPALVTPPVPEGQPAAMATAHMTTDENGRVYILYGYGEGDTGTTLEGLGSFVNFNAYLAIGE